MKNHKPSAVSRFIFGAIATLGSVTFLAACAGGSGGTVNQSEDGLAQVRVGLVVSADSTDVRVGVQEGIFDENGVDVEIVDGQSGDAMLAALMSGDIQFAHANHVSTLSAIAQGMDLVMIGGGAGGGPTLEEAYPNAIIVNPDSPVQTLKDLEGKSIAVNARNNIMEILIREAARLQDVDDSTFQFVEIPFPDMVAALDQERVDSVLVPSPFLEGAIQNGAREIGYPYFEVNPRIESTGIVTTRTFLDNNPETVDHFIAGLYASAEFANENLDVVRTTLPSFTALTPEQAQTVRLPRWFTEPAPETLVQLDGYTREQGVYDAEINIDDHVYVPSDK